MENKITLKAARVSKDLTQAQAAKDVGVSATTIVNWETGKTEIPAGKFLQMCSLYGVSANDILLPR